MVSIPTWFDADFYMASKLAQMQKADPEGKWDAAKLQAAFEEAGFSGAEGIYAHYKEFSLAEGTNPNQYVNQAVYLTAKMEQMQKAEPDAGWTMDKIIAAFKDAGLTVGEHYAAFGVKEGLNPSNDFDNAKYMADKLAQLQKDDPKGEWTAEKVQAAFDKEGLSPLDHFLLYGKTEGLTVKPVDDPIHPYNPGKEFALTTKVDTITGTDADDTITGVASSLSSEGTLNAGDQIDGGEGLDTLKVDMKGNFTGFTGDGKMANVENVELTNSGSIDRTFAAKGVDGATQYTIKGTTNTVHLSDLAAAGITVNLEGVQKDTKIGFTADAVKGESDAMTLGLNGVGAAAKTATGDPTSVKVTTNGVEALTLAATGANYVDLSAAAGATSIAATGAGSLDIKAVANTVTSFDASAMTGAVKADLSASGELTAVKGGAADDTIIVDATMMNIKATVDGGAGADTLVVKGTAATALYTMSGVETVKLANTGALDFIGTNVADLTNIVVSKDATTAATFTKTAVSDITVTLEGATADAADLSIDNAGKTVINATATSGATTSTANAADVILTKSTDVTLNVGASVTSDNDVTAAEATTFTLNVASALKDKVEQTSYTGDVVVAKASSVIVNAEGTLTGATITADKATSAVINTGTTASTLALDAATLTSLAVKAQGNLAFTGSTLTKVESVVAETAGALTGLTGLANVADIQLSGNGKDAAVTLGTLGLGSMEHGLSIVASGLKGGLTFSGDIAANESINLDLTGMTGKVNTTAGTISSTSGDVTVNAVGATDTIGLGAITAKSVTVDASGNGKAITIGSATSDITADTVIFKGADAANDVDFVSNGGATFTLDITGGVKADTYTVTGAAKNTKIVVTADGVEGSGTDALTVTAVAGTTSIDVSKVVNFDTVTVDGKAADAVNITGSASADIITGGKGAGIINAGKGADQIALTGTAGVDTLVLKAGDSLIGAHDGISGFTTATTIDKFDLTSLGLTAIESIRSTDKATIAWGESAISTAEGAAGVVISSVASDIFSSAKIVYATDTTAKSTAIFIDANNNGNWDADTDLVVVLAGVEADGGALADGMLTLTTTA